MRGWVLFAAIGLLSCVRKPVGGSFPEEAEDKSIVFPEFHARPAIMLDEPNQPYELDGVMLRALMIAANDYIPPSTRPRECWQTQEAQEYRVIRRGDIIFVEIGVNPHSHCEERVIPLDDGLRYAISTDGRILRRLATGEPDGSPFIPSDAGVEKSYPVSEEEMDILLRGAGAPSFIPPQWRKDGGSPTSSEPQPRSPGTLDGGVPDGG